MADNMDKPIRAELTEVDGGAEGQPAPRYAVGQTVKFSDGVSAWKIGTVERRVFSNGLSSWVYDIRSAGEYLCYIRESYISGVVG